MPLPATILIYGHDPMLLDTRRWVLEKAGFEVLTIAELDRAAEIVTDQPIDLFLLCHTLTVAERHAAVTTISALQPQMKRLIMTTNAHEDEREEVEGESLHLFMGAEGLIATARRLLS